MAFWLKFFHIAAVSLWFTGLFFLPRLFIARATGDPRGTERLAALGRTLYFGVMTPAAAIAVTLGIALIGVNAPDAWMAPKLALVTGAVLLHTYSGVLLADISRGHNRHRPFVYQLLTWAPLLLALAIAALSGGKPEI